MAMHWLQRMHYFPFIPRLHAYFCTPQLVTLMTWHASNKKQEKEGVMVGSEDLGVWEHANNKWSF